MISRAHQLMMEVAYSLLRDISLCTIKTWFPYSQLQITAIVVEIWEHSWI